MQKRVRELTLSSVAITIKKRVAAYARVSSGKDTMLHSLSAQIDFYRNYIQHKLEWEFAGVYVDEALTGTKDSRAGFKRLIADCRAGLIDMIVTKSVSRFARNTVVLLNTVRELKLFGVDVFFEEQNIHSISGDGELMLTVLASFAQAESLSVSDNCKWRIRKNFREGIPTPMRLYGYDYVGKGLVINPAEAEVVRMVFSDFLNGMGRNAISRKLIAQGVPTKNGGGWSDNIIGLMLRNEKYTGSMLLQKTYSTDHLTKATKINKGELPMYLVKNTHEAIIGQDMFDKVQAELAKRRAEFSPDPKKRAFSELTGKIRCGICGANFRRKTTPYNIFWSCTTFNSKGKEHCASKQIPESILKNAIADVLGLDAYSASAFDSKIEVVHVPENGVLEFVFKDGRRVTRTWENRSRAQSWTDEMRMQARRKTLERSRCLNDT